MAGICSGPGPCDVTPLGTGKNWVTKVGGLPLYIRAIAHALRRSGHAESDAIQLAVGTVQRWARGGGNVTAATRARAAAALAEWERKRAEAHLSGSDAMSIIDLTGPKGYSHGWVRDGSAEADPKSAKDLRSKADAHRRAASRAMNDTERKTHTDRARDFDLAASLVEGRPADRFGIRAEDQYSEQYIKTGKPTPEDVNRMIRNYTTMHGKAPSEQLQRKLRGKAGMMNFSARRVAIDLAGFNPAQPRGPGGLWGSGGSSAPSSSAQVTAQAMSIGVDPAVLAQVAQSLGLSTAQLTSMVQQANAAKAAKKGGASAAKKSASAAKKGAAAAKAASNAQSAAAKKATATQTAAAKLAASVSAAQNAPRTKSSDARAKAINGLPAKQRALLVGSVPPAGYGWTNGSLSAVTHLSGDRMSIDLANELLPDMDAVRKAAGKLDKLPPPLRKAMVAKLMARAKELGATLNLSNGVAASIDRGIAQGLRQNARLVDLAVDQAQRDAAKSAGLTFPGTDSFPLAGPDGKFDRALATKAVRMVQLSNAASAPAIRKWLMSKLKANGAADIIPDAWSSDGTVKENA